MEKHDWFEIWFNDKQGMMETMRRNLLADLDAGYNPHGYAISKQRVILADYEHEFDTRMDLFKGMEDKQVQRWCYYDLKKRGVIE